MRGMNVRLPQPRGPISQALLRALADAEELATEDVLAKAESIPPTGDVLGDEDLHLTLWFLYELHFRGFDDVQDREWDPELIRVRSGLERPIEAELRSLTTEAVQAAQERDNDFPGRLFTLIGSSDGPPLASFLHREASVEELLDFLIQRSVYHLKESDPHSFVLPRIDGAAKVALAELQYDEYGAGRPNRLHSQMFGDALEAAGLDRSYGGYVDQASGPTLAASNLVSMFALQRRLRGAALGQLAAFEVTSSLPCRKIAAGIERLGLLDAVAAYFHEHVEADAVHEQVAVRDICGRLVTAEPKLAQDVLFGAAASLHLDAAAARWLLDSWSADGHMGVRRDERAVPGEAS